MPTTETPPTTPDRDALRALYDEGVLELSKSRSGVDLTAGFYAETGNGVFDAGCLALADYCKGTKAPRRAHTVAAPAGGGKTTFSYALMRAVTRYAERTPGALYGCVFVVDQITKGDEAYRELNALMPGQVAVWTTEHQRGYRKREKVPHPAADFTREELRLYPVIVVTHQFYSGPKRHKCARVCP